MSGHARLIERCFHCFPPSFWHVQESVILVRDLFRDQEANEFIIATIPTVLAVKESSRLLAVLRKEQIPCRRIIVNQV